MKERTTRDEVEDVRATPAAETRKEQGGTGGSGIGVGGMGMGGGGMGGGGGAGFSLKELRTFTSFKNPVYRLYYGAMLGQMASMNMQMVARGLLVFALTGSATALGVMSIANALPMLFFSLFGGVIADRVQKKYVILVGQSVSAIVSLGVALTLVTGIMSAERPGSWMILIVASIFQGTVMGLMMPSRQAMIAEIVGEEQLMNAIALNTFGMNLLRLMAPVPVGFIIYLFDFHAVYFAMTGMYSMAVFFMALMPKTGTITIEGGGALAGVKDGLNYVRHQPTILTILVITFFTVLFSMPYMMLLPVFVTDVLEWDSRGFGMLLSISGVGAISGSLVLASLPNKRRGLMLLVGSLILGLALMGFFFSGLVFPAFAGPLAIVFILFVGLGQTARMTLGNTLLQYYVDDEYRGRVMSLYFMEFGLTNFGVFFAAVLTDLIGVQLALGGLATALVILSLLAVAFVPRIRNLD